MRICQRCGVEVEEDVRRCPLCGYAIHPMTADGSEEPAPAPRKRRETGRSIRRWVIELFSILALTG
ncbi:MAG: zinc-ribbon domain-containing protein, partial [Candidatus Fermentibacterota bacterium]